MKGSDMDIQIITLEKIKSYPHIVLWGLGTYTEEVIALLGEEKIEGIVDSSESKWGEKIGKFTIEDPRLLRQRIDVKRCVFMISVASHNYEIAYNLVHEWAIEENKIFSFTSYFAEKYMYDANAIMGNEEKIRKTLEIFADEPSKRYFKNLIIGKLSRNPICFKENDNIKKEYYYINKGKDICVKSGDTILDCGAYIGDTAELFIKQTQKKCKIYCFEPLKGNYEQLCQWIEKCHYENQIVCINTMLSNYSGKTQIVAPSNTSVSASREVEGEFGNDVRIGTIDEYIDEKVDFIKMDIEGAELEALKGAEKIIRKYKPQMMISAYHRTSHLWEIPERILSIEPQYKIYLGHQPNAAFEPEFYVSI